MLSIGNSAVVNYYPGREKFIQDTFKHCQKYREKYEFRNADYGIGAALNCLVRDYVYANQDQSELLEKKIEFLQNINSANMEQDEDIFLKDQNENREMVKAQADAKAKILPARAALITDTINATTKAMDSASNFASDISQTINSGKPRLQLVA